MKDRLFRQISISAAEESGLIYLLFQSVFLGIFLGTFDVIAHSLFLTVFDEKMMARAYVVSGLTGIILTSFYSWYYTRNRLGNLAFTSFIFCAAVTLLLWVLLRINPSGLVLFLVFIMLGPLNILVMLSFRCTLDNSVQLRPGKKLMPLAEGGLITGIISGCYAIPILLSLNVKPSNILLISAAAVLTVTIIQAAAGKHILTQSGESQQSPPANGTLKPLLNSFREDPLLKGIVVFVVLSVMTAFFIQYLFMAVTRIQFPASGDMAHFLGLFTGSVMTFTLIVKFLVFPYFLRTFRLRTSLIISPFLIALITVVAVVTGFTGGYVPKAAGFILFFILLALSRLFSRLLKESVEYPSVKVVSQAFDERKRLTAEYGIAGTVNEIAAVLSGLVLAGLGILSFMKLIHFSMVLIVIAILWVFAGIRLYARYKNNIIETGAIQDQEGAGRSPDPAFTELKNRFSAEIIFNDDYFSLITGDFRCLENNNNKWYFNRILDQADIKQDINLLPALKKIRAGTGIDKEIRQRSSEIIKNLDDILSGSREKNGKAVNAMVMLADSHRPQTADVLKLLRDRNTDLRKVALCMIRKFRMTELLPEVCECIDKASLEVQAAEVLKNFGREADEALRRFYFRSSGNIEISNSILRLLGTTCSTDNEEFLFSILWSGPRQTREPALKSLAQCNYKIREDEKERLLLLISHVTGILTWNLSARITIKRKNDPLLLEAINKDIERWNSFLFNLLSITYGAVCVNSIRENINSGAPGSVNHALEIIDIVADEAVKSKLKALFDTISDKKKVNILHSFFPGEVNDFEKLAEDIINRDYNLLGVWIRACVIRNMPEIKNNELAQSIVALLFSPETVLREETAKLLARSGKDIYEEASDRIPLQAKERMEEIINGTIPEKELLYEKVKFLESLFHGMPEENLLFLAGKMKYTGKLVPELVPLLRNCILWKSNIGSPDFLAAIFYENVLDGIAGKNSDASCYYLPLQAVEEYHYKFPEHSPEILKYIDEIE